jgi:hypothetical protein
VLDIKWIREKQPALTKMLADRRSKLDIKPLYTLDADRRKILLDLERLQLHPCRRQRRERHRVPHHSTKELGLFGHFLARYASCKGSAPDKGLDRGPPLHARARPLVELWSHRSKCSRAVGARRAASPLHSLGAMTRKDPAASRIARAGKPEIGQWT